MALLARLREVGGNVVWIGRSLIILQVATNAGRAAQVVVVIDVAVRANTWRISVTTGEGKSDRVVIEGGVQPGIRAVTAIASGGETGADVGRICRRFEIRRVTRIALGRHRNELTACRSLMTGVAIDGGVRSG